jgi:iron complex transport system substrate-binding protein
MKTKNKMIALLEIAIVLCSVFLVALPAIATEQTTQKVSLSASKVTTASEDDYVLGIYGNANEDDTIDMRDLTYVKLIFFGKKPETELADAKYDGKINPLDFIQIKLIIVGKEKELTFEDALGKAVTVRKPVERIVILYRDSAETLRALDAADKIVGVNYDVIQADEVYFPELSKLPIVGVSWMKLDYETILSLNPDVLIEFSAGRVDKEKLPGVTVFGLNLMIPMNYVERVRKLGYILDKKEEAEEYINWHESWINKIKSRTKGVSEDEKPKVFLWCFFKPGGDYKTVYTGGIGGSRIHQMCVMAGGKNIAEDLPSTAPWPKVDPEWVIVQNPDIIVASSAIDPNPCGYGTDDPSEFAAFSEDILNRPELANIAAVKNKNVYMMDFRNLQGGGSCCLIGTTYMAKWLHPDIFGDLEPRAIHQEYLDRFQRIDYELDEHGVFVYPPLEG